ncbi:MAG: hypothetical protein Q9211_000459 [Gyalolechia sp. 1 TL-2023]
MQRFTRAPGLGSISKLLRPGSRSISGLPRPGSQYAPPKAWVTLFLPCPHFDSKPQERIVFLNGPVDDTVSSSVKAQLIYLEAEAPEKPIHLYIDTPGGSVNAGLSIYDTMTYISSPVTTTCIGQAASMGSLLLCGGAPKKRFCLPNSSIMIHQPSGGYYGQASDIAIHAKEILRVRERLNEIYQRHLTKPHSLEEIERLMERDKFMGPEEALEMGIVDEILTKRVKDEDTDEKK